MKKFRFTKAAAALMTLALLLVITALPGTALADVSSVTITPNSGESYNIPVGGTVTLNASMVQTGTVTTNPVYAWTKGNDNVDLSAASGAATTVTGIHVGSTLVTLTGNDDSLVSANTSVTINVVAMTISASTLALEGGATSTLTVSNAVPSSISWSTDNAGVATVAGGVVTAVGGGTAHITATSTPASGDTQTKTCTVTVSPKITLLPATQNITLASTSTTVQLKVDYGGDLVSASSTVAWGNSNSTAGTLTSAPTTFTPSGSSFICTATYLSNSTGVNGTSIITATINGAATYTTSKTATIEVRTARYLTLTGDSTLNSSDRYGNYIVTLHEADGSVVNDDTSTVHWSWSSSYLKISSAALNDSRSDMEDGTAEIQLYARYNTPTAGTKLYAWINDDSAHKVSYTIYITGLSSLPQTGQDFTLVYVFGGLCAALLVAAGVWYGIRKKRVTNA